MRRGDRSLGTMVRSSITTALLLVLSAASGGAQEQPVSLEEFEGWRSWTLHQPGDLELDHERLVPILTMYDFQVPTGDTMKMGIEILPDVRFQGQPAMWVNWIGAGGEEGTTNLDAIILNRETFRVLFRIAAAPGDRNWAGTYSLKAHRPGKVVEVTVGDDMAVQRDSLEVDTNVFDFATMGYLFALLDLEEGQRFRLMNVGGGASLEPREVGILVGGMKTVGDPADRSHQVREIRLIANSENAVVTFHVSRTAPFFHGWSYQLVSNGRTFSDLTYRTHTVLRR